jgi:hypothetical protein
MYSYIKQKDAQFGYRDTSISTMASRNFGLFAYNLRKNYRIYRELLLNFEILYQLEI